MSGGARAGIAAAIAVGALATPASADSAFALPFPAERGTVPASAYWADGRPAGDARVEVQVGPERRVHLSFEAGEPDGARLLAGARLAPLPSGEALRLERQRSHSFDETGRSIGRLEIDHGARRARCFDPRGTIFDEIELDARDRVVNAALGLFLRSLANGGDERVAFQLLLCTGGARLVDFEAWSEEADDGSVQVRYGPDWGLASPLARRFFVPPMAFWFDARAPHAWRGHRFPLFSGGPEVLVLRDGLPVGALR